MTKKATAPKPTAAATTAALHADIDAHVPGAPRELTFELGGGAKAVFVLSPIRVKQVFPFLQAARPIFAALVAKPSSPAPVLPPTPAEGGQGGDPTPAPDAVDARLDSADWILGIVEQHGPAVIHAIAIGIAQVDRDQARWMDNIAAVAATLEEMQLVDLIVLLRNFVEINASFFTGQGLTLPLGLALNRSARNPADAAARTPK